MTVIACKDGVMAADTSSWHGDIKRGCARKIIRLPDGSLFGAGGWKPIIEQARHWLRDGMPYPTPKEANDGDLDGLLLRPDGSLFCLGNRFVLYASNTDFEAAGSHTEFLYGAMLAGASAEAAVRLAVTHCSRAGGDVQVEWI